MTLPIFHMHLGSIIIGVMPEQSRRITHARINTGHTAVRSCMKNSVDPYAGMQAALHTYDLVSHLSFPPYTSQVLSSPQILTAVPYCQYDSSDVNM